MNYPFRTYPNVITSEYIHFEHYVEQVKELNTWIKKYKPESGTLFHLCIGAAMEEYMSRFQEDCVMFQWRQLFPYWLEEYAMNNPTKPIRILIVSPNREFHLEECAKTPRFVNETNSLFDWIVDGYKIKSGTFNIEIQIFSCPMPHICTKNSSFCSHYRKQKYDQIAHFADKIKQTEDDRAFVKEFYEEVSRLFKDVVSMLGYVSIYSFAVFRQGSENAIHINNFAMFDEIIPIARNLPSESYQLCEWIYTKTGYIMTERGMYTSYMEPEFGKGDVDTPKFLLVKDRIIRTIRKGKVVRAKSIYKN